MPFVGEEVRLGTNLAGVGEVTLQDVADKVDDVARALTRQAATLGALTDRREAGPDVPLLVELHALRADALACAATARSHRERDGFTALAAGLERLLVGRGGAVVAPSSARRSTRARWRRPRSPRPPTRRPTARWPRCWRRASPRARVRSAPPGSRCTSGRPRSSMIMIVRHAEKPTKANEQFCRAASTTGIR